MLHRRDFIHRTLQGSSLLAMGSMVPEFVANTAFAADKAKKKETILVLIELDGGNDGLNTVIPYADDEYHKARPTLRFTKKDVVKVDDEIGLHPAMRRFENLLGNGQLAIVQGVGYPNPNRSHFESMDVWQSADPRGNLNSGWINRSIPELQQGENIPVMQLARGKLPLILDGPSSGVVSLATQEPSNNRFNEFDYPGRGNDYRLRLGTNNTEEMKARRKLLDEVTKSSKKSENDLLSFVQRRQTETYTTLDRLSEFLDKEAQRRDYQYFASVDNNGYNQTSSLVAKLQLITRLINLGFGARVFYTKLSGFDTHSSQAQSHRKLVGEAADAIHYAFQSLKNNGNDKQVVMMTYSEFGRRVNENGSKGTDHGSGSCLFVAGPAVKGGVIGKHPSLKTLVRGDLQYHTDFRRVYATLLDNWLGVDSKTVLQGEYEHLPLMRKKT